MVELTKVSIGISLIAIILSSASVALTLNMLAGVTNEIDLIQGDLGVVKDMLQINETETIAKAKEEGELLIYATALPKMQSVLDKFQAKFPFIKVTTLRLLGVEIFERFKTEAAAGIPTCDIFETSDVSMFMNLTDEGYLMKYLSPEYEQYPEDVKNSEGYWCTYRMYTLGFAYNTNLVPSTEAPKSWSDLLDPKYKGWLGNADPHTSSSAYLLLYGAWMNLGRQWWEKIIIDQQATLASGGGAANLEALAAGQYKAVFWAAHYDTQAFIDRGAPPVKFVTPTDGVIAPLTPMGITAYARHPNAAKLFIDWILSEAGQKAVMGDTAYPYAYSCRKGMPAPTGFLPVEQLNLWEMNWTDVAEKRKYLLSEIDQLYAQQH
jgi:iron(III) transport system substrate-binding protein